MRSVRNRFVQIDVCVCVSGVKLMYSRHHTEFSSRFDALPLLDVVGRNRPLSANAVLRFIPVWVLRY